MKRCFILMLMIIQSSILLGQTCHLDSLSHTTAKAILTDINIDWEWNDHQD